MGMTFTHEAYRGRGFAKRVIVKLCRELLSLRGRMPLSGHNNNYSVPWTPYCYIDPGTCTPNSVIPRMIRSWVHTRTHRQHPLGHNV